MADHKTNVAAVRAELRDVTVAPGLRKSALSLAAILDETTSARDIATVARELRQTLAAIAERHDAAQAVSGGPDALERLRAERQARRAG